MRALQPLLLSLLIAVCLTPGSGWADGSFVAPKFVWDKHKDINEPTQKAIIVYDAGQEDLVLQVKYEGPLDQFGWIVPVPNQPTVQAGSMQCFYELSRFTQQQQLNRQWKYSMAGAYGTDGQSESGPPPVNVVETKTVGAYDIAVLSAKDSGALAQWLDDNRFYIPPDKSNVLNAYVQMHWYFVAIKINLGKSFLHSTSNRLASGELNPLQIGFASERCIFPLRISSINGKPSEVQVYVLAQEPLLDQTMYDRDLAIIHSNDVVRVEESEQRINQIRKEEMLARRGLPPPPPRLDDATSSFRMPVRALPAELMEFDKAAPGDLPDCARMMPLLAGRSWWISKRTWSFAPDEMRDLDFGPALPVLAETLGSEKYGYIASEDLAMLGTNAIPIVLATVAASGPVMRANAAGILEDNRDFISDPRIKAAAPALLKNSEPKARLAAIDILTSDPKQRADLIEELLPLLHDSDSQVRQSAEYAVARLPDVRNYAPVFHKMLTDTNPTVQIAALRVINIASLPISHDELFPFFKIPDRSAVGISTGYFRSFGNYYGYHYDLSNEQVVPLLHNSEPLARCIGLRILGQNAAADSIALATPLLDDPNPTVRYAAARTINQLKEPPSEEK